MCFWKNEFEWAFEAKLSKVFVRNNFAFEHHIANLAQKRGIGPVSSKNSNQKRVF